MLPDQSCFKIVVVAAESLSEGQKLGASFEMPLFRFRLKSSRALLYHSFILVIPA